MTELRRAWGPNAVTRWTLLVTFAMVVLVGLPAFAEVPEYTLLKRVLIAAASAIPALAVLALARVTWLAPATGGRRAPRAIVTFAAAGALAGATRGWIIDAAGITNPIPPAWRIPATAVAGVIWLAIVAILVDHVREHRATMRSLREQQATLAALDIHEREELEQVTRDLRGELGAPARDALGRITTELNALHAGGDLAAAAARVDSAVASTIRPLSHDLLTAEPTPMPAMARPDALTARERAARLVGLAARRVTHSPWLVSAIPVLLFPLIAGPRWGTAFLVTNAVITWIVLALLLVVLRALLEPLLARLPAVAALIALIAGYVGVVAITVMVSWGLDSLSPLAVGFQAVALVTIPAILMGASVLEAAAALGREDERSLRAVNAEVTWALARTRQRVRHEHQMLGALLHGTAQGTLVSIARSLEALDPGMPADDRARVVQDALTRLDAVRVMIEEPRGEEQPFGEALDDVALVWNRVLDIDIDLDPAVRSALEADPAAARTVVDVVAEALTNAARHGGARRVRITARRDGRTVDLQVEDDGSLSPSPEPGMGSRLLDEASPDWSLSRASGHTVLRVMIPLG